MTTQITLALISVLFFMLIKFVMDAIAHYDFFTKIGWPYFWSRTAKEAPKTNWFYRYFPMFHDAWHLATFLQVFQICLIVSIPCNNVWIFPILLVISGLVFNVLNDWASKVK